MSFLRFFYLSLVATSTVASAANALDLTLRVSSYQNTHTHTPIPEPAPSFAQLDKSYKLAGICFLGVGDCGNSQTFSSGDDFSIDTVKQCKNEGFNVTSCTFPAYPTGVCPYNSNYYLSCKTDNQRACKDSGYVNTCSDGYVKNDSQICSYDSSYYKCKCNPCDGYTYTYAQATTTGYVTDGSCNSCGTMKYKRKENPCSGYLTCECGGEIGTPTCKSGTVTKYQTCKSCCENRCTEATCPSGYICEKEACSNKYCITGCAVNYTDWCTAPITDCGALGYTKTASQCPDGYLKCPYGDTVFCPTETKCAIGDIYYTDKTCSSADNYSSTKTVLGIVIYITDGGMHGQIMAPWWVNTSGNKSSRGVGMEWGDYGTDIPSLPNYTSSSSAEADYDSCGNTDKIVAAGSASTYLAAWATRYYAPTTETKGKWCLPAAGILRNIQNNRTAINTALNKVGGASNMLSYWVWSSSESTYNYAWGANLNNSYLYNYYKGSYDYYVVPVLEF